MAIQNMGDYVLGDTLKVIEFAIESAPGVPLDLTGATVTTAPKGQTDPAITSTPTVTVTDAAGGIVQLSDVTDGASLGALASIVMVGRCAITIGADSTFTEQYAYGILAE